MELLTIIFIIIAGASLLSILKDTKVYQILILCFIGLILIILAGLRTNDRDFLTYIEIFDSSPFLFQHVDTSEIHSEPGYLFINSLLKSLGLGYRSVFITLAIASVSLSLYYFKKHTKYFLIAVLIYFSHVYLLRDMMQIRAGLAASISLYAIKYIDKRRIIPFLLIIGGAALMHGGVLILVLAYFLFPFLQRNLVYCYWLVLAGFIMGILFNQALLEFIFTSILNIPAVSIYLLDPEYFNSLGLLNPVLLKNVFLLFIILKYRDYLLPKVLYLDAMIVLMAIGAFWLSAFNNFSILAARIATYFTNVEHLLLPALFYLKINKFILWGIIILYCLYVFLSKFGTFENLSFIFL